MKEVIKDLVKGIYAGVMIGIGGTIYLSLDNKILGAFFFAIGLMSICIFGMNLYTGKIGYLLSNKKKYLVVLLMSIIGNFIGTYLVSFLISKTRFNVISSKAYEISMIKINDSLLSILILAFFCGILMYIAVDNFKNSASNISKYLGIFMCVIVFILCGFEHCVANMFYFSMGAAWSMKALLSMIVMIIGNSLGSIMMNLYNTKFK